MPTPQTEKYAPMERECESLSYVSRRRRAEHEFKNSVKKGMVQRERAGRYTGTSRFTVDLLMPNVIVRGSPIRNDYESAYCTIEIVTRSKAQTILRPRVRFKDSTKG